MGGKTSMGIDVVVQANNTVKWTVLVNKYMSKLLHCLYAMIYAVQINIYSNYGTFQRNSHKQEKYVLKNANSVNSEKAKKRK